MKFVCLGYFDESSWNSLSEAEQAAFMDSCFAYDAELRRGGHFLGGDALLSAEQSVTVRPRGGSVTITDGPFTELKEQIGGILYLEANDLTHAVQLMSKHPGVKAGGFEIRAVDEEFNKLIRERVG